MSKPTESEIIAELEKLRTLGKNDLRVRWSKTFGKIPPPALTKDLLGRMIAWRIQEKFCGGHDKATRKTARRARPW
jgi:hypothetical protein